MSKSARQALIRKLLERGPIRSQTEVLGELETHGIDANQATISRDFRELGVIKTTDGYVLPGSRPTPENPLAQLSQLQHVYSVETAGNLVVLKTPPGLASPTAIELDRSEHPDVVGTVAGDDTVFLAVRSPRAAKAIAEMLLTEGAA